MRRRSKQNAFINTMNVVPYIDVMLVLLVIFIVSAPLFVPGIINLPSVGKAEKVAQQPVEINITKDDHYSITQNNKTLAVDNVTILIQQVIRLAPAETPVVISADKTIEYNKVIEVVDKLYASGIKKIALVVKERNG